METESKNNIKKAYSTLADHKEAEWVIDFLDQYAIDTAAIIADVINHDSFSDLELSTIDYKKYVNAHERGTLLHQAIVNKRLKTAKTLARGDVKTYGYFSYFNAILINIETNQAKYAQTIADHLVDDDEELSLGEAGLTENKAASETLESLLPRVDGAYDVVDLIDFFELHNVDDVDRLFTLVDLSNHDNEWIVMDAVSRGLKPEKIHRIILNVDTIADIDNKDLIVEALEPLADVDAEAFVAARSI